MNWKKIFTIAALTGFSASVATGQGTAPTIVQGDYISNVFGQSNFIKNPNAKLNTKDVTVSNATVTRSTTTPLVATSEFNITTSTSTGYADWATRTFDAGMKNQNCEARFTYRGFSVGSTTVQIRQGSNTVAQLTLTASTDPRIASINFPCGDLSAATTLRVQQATASLTGTNELSGLYLGLATNLGQLNTVGVWQSYTPTVTPGAGSLTSPVIDFAQWRRVGENIEIRILYQALQSTSNAFGWTLTVPPGISMVTDTVTTAQSDRRNTLVRSNGGSQYPGSVKVVNSTLFEVTPDVSGGVFNAGTTYQINLQFTQKVQGWGADPVVTPERQNVYGGVVVDAGAATAISAASWTNFTMAGTPTRTYFGKAQAPSTVGDVAIKIPSLPVGNYQITFSGQAYSISSAAGSETQCLYAFYDGSTRLAASVISATGDSSVAIQGIVGQTFTTIFNNTSVQDKTFTLQGYRNTGGGSCNIYSDSTRKYTITITPLDQPSNSALYVQGPVKAAATGDAVASGYQMEGVANANNLSLTNGQLIRDLSTFVPGARVTLITRTLTPGNYLVSAHIYCNNMPASIGLILYGVSDGLDFVQARTVNPVAGGYASNTFTNYLRVTNNMVYKIDAEAGGVISGTCTTMSTVVRLN